jgi:RNA polymerase sigma-70 factor, ECF subfamily
MESDFGRAPERLGAKDLFVSQARFVAGFLVGLGMGGSGLDDLVQEVFLVVHRRGGFVPGKGKATTWLAHIAVYVASNARRTERRRREDADDAALGVLEAPGAGPHESAEVAESIERVRCALDKLDLAHRAVFLLVDVEGDSCEETARGLGIPVGTVYSRLHKARKDFQAAHARLVERASEPLRLGQPQGAFR